MPFDKDLANVCFIIKQACEKAGTYAERVDDQIFQERILDRIYNQIAKADVVVADMTRRNPNVFYEVGYAHALNKVVIPLAQTAEDIPFDLKDYPHIIYGRNEGAPDLELLDRELVKRVKQAIESPEASIKSLQHLRFEVQRKGLAGKPTIHISSSGRRKSEIEITLNIQNSVEEVIRAAEFKLAVQTSEALSTLEAARSASETYRVNTIHLEEQSRYLHLIRDKFILMPGEWESLKLKFHHGAQPGQTEEVVFQVLTDWGEQSYSCILAIDAQR